MSLDDRLRRGLAEAAGRAPIDPDADQRAALALGRRRQRRQRLALASALVVVVAGVTLGVWQLAGGDGSDGTTIAGPGSTTTVPGDGEGAVPGEETTAPPEPADGSPPIVVVSSPDESLELPPFAYCYGSVCADGAPASPSPDIGTADGLIVAFPLSDWSFTATLTEVVPDGQCPREQQVPLDGSGGTSFALLPAGPAGTYDVTLFGRGDGGDVAVAFRWTSRFDGPLAKPTARLAVLADDDRVDSYGVELEVANLDRTPDAASATITVRAADGQEVSFPAPGTPDATCREGYLYWAGALDQGLAAAGLADQSVADEGPFTYEVDLVLDGVHHTATATWPDDQIPGNEPSVALHFDPPLPALTER